MKVKIVDKDVQGVVVLADEGGWYLRLQAPSILEEALEDDKRNYIWYAMRSYGWSVVSSEQTKELEEAYINALGH